MELEGLVQNNVSTIGLFARLMKMEEVYRRRLKSAIYTGSTKEQKENKKELEKLWQKKPRFRK